MSRSVNKFLCCVLLAISLVGMTFAQGGATGAITGTVQDSSGAVVANAEVRIVERLLRNGVVGIGHVAHPQLVEERRACGVRVLKGEHAVIERLKASEPRHVRSAAAEAGQGDVQQ